MDQLRAAVIRTLFQRDARRVGVSLAITVTTSLVLFASVNAWRARPAPLAHTHASPEALAEAVIGAIGAGDVQRLQALVLTEEEFRTYVWPGLPASRPERNVPFEFVWDMLHQKSVAYLRQTIARFEGQPLTLVRVEFGGAATAYDDVMVRRQTRFVVRTRDGDEQVIRMVGSTIEQDGRYKVFSYVVDE